MTGCGVIPIARGKRHLKKILYITTLFMIIAGLGLSGCAHQTQGISAAHNGDSSTSDKKTTCNPEHRTTLSYSVSEDADINDVAPGTGGNDNGDDQGDRINFGGKNQKFLDAALNFCQQAQDYWYKGQFEKAISSLDHAYGEIIKVDTYNRPNLIQQKADLRLLITRRIQDIYGSRNVMSKGSYNAIPRVMNAYVQAEIESLTTGCEKDFFINAYRRSGLYRKYIESQLVQEGLPIELAWLPLIESGYNVRAFSPARALGLWQFITSTGYRFGLSRDKFVDERMDPYKSTKAAIAYLKELHHMFGDWETVLAAYNCGEGRVLRVISEQRINYLDNFWDLYAQLPHETARYVPRFMATLQIVSNLKKYGLDGIVPESPLEFETLPIPRQLQLKNIADATGILEQTLKRLNPELRYGITPGNNYSIKIPPGTSQLLTARLNDIPAASVSFAASVSSEETTVATESTPPQEHHVIHHKVKRGESLGGLAKHYHTSVKSIMQANNMRKAVRIVPGKVLVIPQSASQTVVAAKETTRESKRSKEHLVLAKAASHETSSHKKTAAVHTATHTVKTGDSLYSIAREYGVTPKEIQKANRLSSATITLGENLKIPAASAEIARVKPEGAAKVRAEKKQAHLKKYLVKKNDSAFSIASSHNMPIDRFLSINNLSPGTKIFPGQKVFVE
jgi:membrane-bound lytic murein transglycosylase D